MSFQIDLSPLRKSYMELNETVNTINKKTKSFNNNTLLKVKTLQAVYFGALAGVITLFALLTNLPIIGGIAGYIIGIFILDPLHAYCANELTEQRAEYIKKIKNTFNQKISTFKDVIIEKSLDNPTFNHYEWHSRAIGNMEIPTFKKAQEDYCKIQTEYNDKNRWFTSFRNPSSPSPSHADNDNNLFSILFGSTCTCAKK